jgi:ribosomal protein L40E
MPFKLGPIELLIILALLLVIAIVVIVIVVVSKANSKKNSQPYPPVYTTPGNQTNFCPKCGASLPPGSAFCMKCGARLNQ